jgi:hypothetical protein
MRMTEPDVVLRGRLSAWRHVLWCACCAGLAGCMPTAGASFDSAEPAARNAAIVQAAKQRDASSLPQLVRMLASDDPATRVLAIRTLEKLTGETKGFDAAGSDEQRAAGIKAWDAWLAGRESGGTAHRGGTP